MRLQLLLFNFGLIFFSASTGTDRLFAVTERGVVELKDESKLVGFISMQADGSVQITENPYFSNLQIEKSEIASVKIYEKIKLILPDNSMQIVLLADRNENGILFETLGNPRIRNYLSNSQFSTISPFESEEELSSVLKKNFLRFTVSAGYLSTSGALGIVLPGLPNLSVGSNFDLKRFIPWNLQWLPAGRLEITTMMAQNGGREYTAINLYSGFHYPFYLLKKNRGLFYAQLLPGLAFEQASSETFNAFFQSFSAIARLGYEYSFSQTLSLTTSIDGLYTHDTRYPLLGFGISVGTGYSW